jgi:hypothetical protein
VSHVDQKDVQRRPPVVECDALPVDQQQRAVKQQADFNYGILLWLLVLVVTVAKVLLGVVLGVVLVAKYPKLMLGGMLGLRSVWKKVRNLLK